VGNIDRRTDIDEYADIRTQMDAHTDGEQRDLISILLIFQSKGNRLIDEGKFCSIPKPQGRVIGQAVSRWPLEFDPGSVHVGFVVDTAVMGRVFS
jgi:hypothetical protein